MGMEIVFTFSLKEDQQQQLQQQFPDVSFHFNYETDTHLEIADVLVTYGGNLTAENIAAAKNLKWIMVASAGIEKMPKKEIAERGITVSNVKGLHKTAMSESILAHILALKRTLPEIYESQKRGTWEKVKGATELRGSTALILGPGAIGGEVGRLLQAFGVKTIGCNRTGKDAPHMDELISFSSLEARLPEADYVIAVLPSTDETKGLLKDEHFKAMKDDAVFMNFGRGDLVDETVLIEVLKRGDIGHAVLDVFVKEPLPDGHPFWTMANVTVSPHVSSASGKYVDRVFEIFTPNLEKWQAGDKGLTNLVDMERGY